MPEDRYLLFLGDLIHGPLQDATEWPAALGQPYRDASPAMLLKLSLLMEQHPGRVHALLGNHEHAHVGGPPTARFAPDEAAALERRLGPEAVVFVREWLLGWPLYAQTARGLLLGHRPPAPALSRLADLEGLDYRSYVPPAAAPGDRPSQWNDLERAARLCGHLLWAQPLRVEAARALCASPGVRALVAGHEVVKGYELLGFEQLVFSSSFGVPDEDKRVLDIDLSAPYRSARDLREGREIIPLYD